MSEFLHLGLVHAVQTVLDEGSFRRAAERLHVSGPALTQQVRRLEEAVGYTLLQRDQHPIRLTGRGERFMLHAREALAASRRALDESAARELRIGFITGYPRSNEEPFLADFRHRHPEVELQFLQIGWGEQSSRLRAGDLDAMLARPPIEHTGDLDVVTVFREPRVVAVHESSPLAARDALTLAELDHVPVVGARSASQEWTRYWVMDPRPSGVPVRYGARAGTLEESLAFVASAGNILITAESVSKRYQYPGVRCIPLVDAPDCGVMLCTRSDDMRAPIRGLWEAAAAAALD